MGIYSTYFNQATLPLPFCPGCGHRVILQQLDAALVKLQPDPYRVVIVTDIGCAGLSDKFFITNGFHGLHGRSVTYATGMKLADPKLKVIVLVGDGGCGIGGHHLINAARRNIGVSVLVFNNFNYGMTGGEHSVSTPPGAITATTPLGQLEQPMDICQTVAANGAGYVARTTAYQKDLPDLIAEAISHAGFSLVDIWELCTAYFAPNNSYNRKKMEATLRELNFSTGVLQRQARPEYSQAYRQALAGETGGAPRTGCPLKTQFSHGLERPMQVVVAGAAGMKVVTAASLLSQGAVLSGLWASQRSDYPVMVKSGYSLSGVVLSPEPVQFAGITRPDILVVLSAEGLKQVEPVLAAVDAGTRLYINDGLLPLQTAARVYPLALSQAGKPQTWAVAALAEVLRHNGIYPVQALEEAIRLKGKYAEVNLKALAKGRGMLVA